MPHTPDFMVDASINALLDLAVELADASQMLMDGTMDPVNALLDENDVVFALWRDPSLPRGIGYRVTEFHGRGRDGHVVALYIEVPRRQAMKVQLVL